MTAPLQAVSYLAPNMFWFYNAIGQAISRTLNSPVELSDRPFDPLADPLIRDDQIELAFMCGLPYTTLNHPASGQLIILAAPVMQAARYHDQPVYFADMIVRADNAIYQFNDLAGKTLCYNELGSNSGYNLLRYHMLQNGLTHGFFAHTMATGAHLESIRWVLDGRADCSTIDSTVLEQAFRDHPEWTTRLRICVSIGPSPMPPILASTRLGMAQIDRMRAALIEPDSILSEAMTRAHVRRFAAMQAADYLILGDIRDQAISADFAVIR